METIFAVQSVDKTYPGGVGLRGRRSAPHVALKDVSLEIREGERVAVVGESGSGKTTLARTLLRLSRPTSGEVLYRGRPLWSFTGAEHRRFRAEVRMLFQNVGAMINPLMKVREIIEEPMQTHTNWKRPRIAERTAEVMTQVRGDMRWLDVYPHRLSGGECRRVALARALAVPPAVLVADEPVAGLDVVVQKDILELISEAVRSTGGTLVVISHNISVLDRLCDRYHVMYGGRIVESLVNAGGEPVTPRHPYSVALFRAAAYLERGARLKIDGPLMRPRANHFEDRESGCVFRARCLTYEGHPGGRRCEEEAPPLLPSPPDGRVACHYWNHHDV